jgi:predicted NACHT family NTPase
MLAVLGIFVAAGVVAWRTWSRAAAGTFDPVGAVVALAGLAVSVVALSLAFRAQQQADTDIVAASMRLAVAVANAETEARRQLLGGHDRAINVQFSFRPAVAHDAAGAERRGTLEDVLVYYRKLQPRRLVVTGAPGSGKTMLAVELILGLLKKRSPDAPVPVRMSAASLDTSLPEESAVAAWLAKQLQQTYDLPAATAEQLVAARMVMPVLDGLDEMDAVQAPEFSSRAARAIRACNAFLDGDQKAGMVLTCRSVQYESLEKAREWAQDAARIELRPVKADAARQFLVRRVSDEARWRNDMGFRCLTGRG